MHGRLDVPKAERRRARPRDREVSGRIELDRVRLRPVLELIVDDFIRILVFIRHALKK